MTDDQEKMSDLIQNTYGILLQTLLDDLLADLESMDIKGIKAYAAAGGVLAYGAQCLAELFPTIGAAAHNAFLKTCQRVLTASMKDPKDFS
jgi:hypothetical protein